MMRRKFIKNTTVLSTIAILPSRSGFKLGFNNRIRTAHIGLGVQGGFDDLPSIASHDHVDVVGLCDVDSKYLEMAMGKHSGAQGYADYRKMLEEMGNEIDAVIVATPDHTHAPASMMAMEMGKAVYCQKPLTHHVSESRAMDQIARNKGLVTQMGIQVHSFYDYKLATLLIQSGIIGKVSTVRAWSPKNWGYDGPAPIGEDPVPDTLDWNLWLGTAPSRPYKEGVYHPGNWRKLTDFGCGTLGDMGVHIFDTPYNALQLDVPTTITTDCRPPNEIGFPEINQVTYEFPGTDYTTETLKWVWYDGPGAPNAHTDFALPGMERIPEQGAMFIGEKGKLLLPHFMMLPKLIVDGKYVNIDTEIADLEKSHDLGKPIRNYSTEGPKHYHQFIDACLGNAECSAPFSYAARLTEVILLGVVAQRFPNKTLNWNSEKATFAEGKANAFLEGQYREF